MIYRLMYEGSWSEATAKEGPQDSGLFVAEDGTQPVSTPGTIQGAVPGELQVHSIQLRGERDRGRIVDGVIKQMS